MATMLPFPISQERLKAFYERNAAISVMAEILARNAMNAEREPLSPAQAEKEILLPAHLLLDNRKSMVTESTRIANDLRAGAKLTPGVFSCAWSKEGLRVTRNGRPSPHLADHWVLAEKDWTHLTLIWVDENYSNYLGLPENQVIGNRIDNVFGEKYGPTLLEHEEYVQATMRPRLFREVVHVRGSVLGRYAVRFPIYAHNDLEARLTWAANMTMEPSPFSLAKPIAMGCICWNADDPAKACAV